MWWHLDNKPEVAPTNPLMRRTLRFIDYNISLYIHHRNREEYSLAVERLRRIRKLINVINLAERRGKYQMCPMDQANVWQLERHLQRIGI